MQEYGELLLESVIQTHWSTAVVSHDYERLEWRLSSAVSKIAVIKSTKRSLSVLLALSLDRTMYNYYSISTVTYSRVSGLDS